MNLENFQVCYLTKNDCYNDGRWITPAGIMVHSTGANNPNVNRYVPIGTNYSSNHWNKPGLKKCVHGFLGYMPDKSIGFAQCLPWTKRGWHAGGAANNTHIGFEICEDGLTDQTYFDKIYSYTVRLCGELCKEFNLDPLKKGVLICHQEGYQQKLASNHADVLHWFPKHGKSMDDLRIAVYNYIKGGTEEMTQEQFNQFMNNWLLEQAAKPYSSWAKKEKVEEFVKISGISDGSSPQLYATREQVSAMIKRALESYGMDLKGL